MPILPDIFYDLCSMNMKSHGRTEGVSVHVITSWVHMSFSWHSQRISGRNSFGRTYPTLARNTSRPNSRSNASSRTNPMIDEIDRASSILMTKEPHQCLSNGSFNKTDNNTERTKPTISDNRILFRLFIAVVSPPLFGAIR